MGGILTLILSMLASTGGHVAVKKLLSSLGGKIAASGTGAIGEAAAKQIGPKIGSWALTGKGLANNAADLAAMTVGGIGGFHVAQKVLAPDEVDGAVAQGHTQIHMDQMSNLQQVAMKTALDDYLRGNAEDDVQLDRMLNEIVNNAPQQRRLV
jgi:hypothetical protein